MGHTKSNTWSEFQLLDVIFTKLCHYKFKNRYELLKRLKKLIQLYDKLVADGVYDQKHNYNYKPLYEAYKKEFKDKPIIYKE